MDYSLLIADDEKHILSGLKETLNWASLGFSRVETAQNYTEIVDKLLELRPDIALFDVCIGKHRCFEIIKQLQPFGLKTNFIIISGYGDFEYVRQSMLLGAKDYLLKPVDRHQLKSSVEKVIVNDLGGEILEHDNDEQNIDPVLGVLYDSLSKLSRRVILTIHSDYEENLTLKVIADQFKMNSTYLGQVFIKDLNIKFSEYLMIYRLLMAKEMIENTSEKISYIARRVGYTNTNYFYSHFNSYFNKSPSDFRYRDEGNNLCS